MNLKLCAFAPPREENFLGFGSLDEEKLDKVMHAWEKLHNRDRMVGVISRVREMKELVVEVFNSAYQVCWNINAYFKIVQN